MLANFPDDFDTAAFLQLNIGNHHIGPRTSNGIHCLMLTLGEADDIEITKRVDVVDDPLANQRRIFHNKNAYWEPHHPVLKRCSQFIKLWRSAYAVRSALREKCIFSSILVR